MAIVAPSASSPSLPRSLTYTNKRFCGFPPSLSLSGCVGGSMSRCALFLLFFKFLCCLLAGGSSPLIFRFLSLSRLRTRLSWAMAAWWMNMPTPYQSPKGWCSRYLHCLLFLCSALGCLLLQFVCFCFRCCAAGIYRPCHEKEESWALHAEKVFHDPEENIIGADALARMTLCV